MDTRNAARWPRPSVAPYADTSGEVVTRTTQSNASRSHEQQRESGARRGRGDGQRAPTPRLTWSQAERVIARHRRSIGIGLATVSVLAAIHALRPADSATVDVLVASRDLASGVTLHSADLEHRALATADRPPNVITDASALVDHVLTASIETGEVFTRTRVLSTSRVTTSGGTGLVSTPVRLADSGAVALLEPGDHVDILATSSSIDDNVATPTSARLVAADATVLTIPRTRTDTSRGPLAASDSSTAWTSAGALIVVATTLETARILAASGARGQLSIVIRPR